MAVKRLLGLFGRFKEESRFVDGLEWEKIWTEIICNRKMRDHERKDRLSRYGWSDWRRSSVH